MFWPKLQNETMTPSDDKEHMLIMLTLLLEKALKEHPKRTVTVDDEEIRDQMRAMYSKATGKPPGVKIKMEDSILSRTYTAYLKEPPRPSTGRKFDFS